MKFLVHKVKFPYILDFIKKEWYNEEVFGPINNFLYVIFWKLNSVDIKIFLLLLKKKIYIFSTPRVPAPNKERSNLSHITEIK